MQSADVAGLTAGLGIMFVLRLSWQIKRLKAVSFVVYALGFCGISGCYYFSDVVKGLMSHWVLETFKTP